MPKTLAEMRAAGVVRRPRQSLSLCLAPDLVAKAQVLLRQRLDIDPEYGIDPEDRVDQGPRRINDPKTVRLREINDQLASLDAEMAEHTGELTLQAIDPGEWRRWCDQNPPRDASKKAESLRDNHVAGGYCNADALLADLRKYAVEFNGEQIGDDDWEFIAANAAAGDLKEAARTVVAMHEQDVDLGKWRTLLRGSREIATD